MISVNDYRKEQLKEISDSVGERRGWDFSELHADQDPSPWDYLAIVRRYLRPTSRVLDIGTGGGEAFLKTADSFGFGVGIDNDPGMMKVARENLPTSLADRVSFRVMSAEKLDFPAASFDIVLNRHAPIFIEEISRVLQANGLFITQQVGGRNTQNVFEVFGWGSNGEYWTTHWERKGVETPSIIFACRQADKLGFQIIARAEWNIPYYFLDVESFIFWLKAAPLPERFDPEKHWELFNTFISRYTTSRGIQTNNHRELLILQKAL